MRVAAIFVLFCILCTGFSWVQYRRQGSAAKLIRPLLRVLHGQSAERLVDISPTKDRTILKEVIRRGDTAKAKAGNKDSVEIAWQIRDAGGSVLHDSNGAVRVAEPSSVGKQGDVVAHDKEVFSFQLGADPRQVILGWEHALRTMHEGEKARVILSPQWAFGSKGAPPIIPPDATLHCELEVLRIIPALSKRFRTIGINESIEAELADSIDSGRSPIAQAVMHTDRSAQHSSNVGAAQGAGVIPMIGTPASEAAPGASVKEDGTTAKYFDSTKHKVDANLRLQGEGTGYEWSESKDSLDIELPLRGALVSAGTRVSKTDVDVTVRYVAYHLSQHYPCSHPLHGPVIAVVSASMYNHEHPLLQAGLYPCRAARPGPAPGGPAARQSGRGGRGVGAGGLRRRAAVPPAGAAGRAPEPQQTARQPGLLGDRAERGVLTATGEMRRRCLRQFRQLQCRSDS
jgi:hypothetical protein